MLLQKHSIFASTPSLCRMGKKARIFLIALCVVLLGCLAWFGRRPNEPVYQGKYLSDWLKDAANAARPQRFKNTPEQRKADEAIRAVGTNAIPILLQFIRAKDADVTRQALRLDRQLKLPNLPIIPAGCLNSVGDQGFRILGPEAKEAVPALIQIFEEHLSDSSQDSAVTALGWIGSASAPAVPYLLQAMTNVNPVIRLNAVYGLRLIHAEPEKVVPALIKALKDSEFLVQENAAEALENFGPKARIAVPQLLTLLNDDDNETRSMASNILKAIDYASSTNAVK